MDGRQSGSPPGPRQRSDPLDLCVELGRRYALETGHETGPGRPGALPAQAIEGGIVFEPGIVEPHDDARRPGGHDIADREPGRIFEDEDLGPCLALCRGIPAMPQDGAFGDHQGVGQAGQHAVAAVLERHDGRRAERRQDPGRVRSGAAECEPDGHAASEPGRHDL